LELPETILQFGAGRFLRAFADFFIHQANEQGQTVGRIVVVQSTGDERAGSLNRQSGRYHIVIRGLADGTVVDRVEESRSISRALVASSQWSEVLAVARSPALRVILSNTTEVGYTLLPDDTPDSDPPRSFPAKLLLVLKERFESGLPGVTIIPCELREHNAEVLRDLLLKQAGAWSLPDDFMKWLQGKCDWLNTLVDRIVTGPPKDHALLAQDALLSTCEPYALWAIQQKVGREPFLRHPAVTWTPDVQSYFLRKVRLLNGGHTALLIRSGLNRFKTVKEAISDPELGNWLERLLFEEIVPTLEGRVEKPVLFARQVLERFRNPFLEHKLTDIANYHEEKVKVRLIPTLEEFKAKFQRTPALLAEVLNKPLR